MPDPDSVIGTAQHPLLVRLAREFGDIFDRSAPPDEPIVCVAVISEVNLDHAPLGYENWFVLVSALAAGSGFDRGPEKAAYCKRVLATPTRFGLDERDHIVVDEDSTPEDLAQRTGAWRGALYGASPDSPLSTLRGQAVRDGQVRGLHFAGGTVHPGGGVLRWSPGPTGWRRRSSWPLR